MQHLPGFSGSGGSGISTLDILVIMEYLAQSGMSADHITNYITAVRSLCIVYNCDTSPFRHQIIPLFIKSLKLIRLLSCQFLLRKHYCRELPILIEEKLLSRTASAHLQTFV